jgi:hypothetical protein
MKYQNAALVLPLLAAIAAGCTTMGIDGVAPLWDGWYSGWRGAGFWGAAPSTDFITHYSGRVVANLATSNATHMRCKFQLVHPSEGMSGGGSGQCQLPDGKTIDASFPTA